MYTFDVPDYLSAQGYFIALTREGIPVDFYSNASGGFTIRYQNVAHARDHIAREKERQEYAVRIVPIIEKGLYV